MRMTIMVQSMYTFPLSLFKRRIATEFREVIKQKVNDLSKEASEFRYPAQPPEGLMEQIAKL